MAIITAMPLVGHIERHVYDNMRTFSFLSHTLYRLAPSISLLTFPFDSISVFSHCLRHHHSHVVAGAKPLNFV